MLDFLRKVPVFADLPEEDLIRLSESTQLVNLPAGKLLFREGTPGDKAYVIKEGLLEIVKETPNGEVLLAVRGEGEVIGEMALLETQVRTASVRARKDTLLIAIGKAQLEHLVKTSLSASNALFSTVLRRLRMIHALLQQSEKMAELGKLTAQVAHELNNPAAAVQRNSKQLDSAIQALGEQQVRLSQVDFSPEQREMLKDLEKRAHEQAAHPIEMEALVRSDLEADVETWLEDQGAEDAWDLAPVLVNLNFDLTELQELGEKFSMEQLGCVTTWLCAVYSVYSLLNEMNLGATRISDIVKDLKSYAYLDQAPVLNVNVNEGLESTVMMMRSKIDPGVRIQREYDPNLPTIQAYARELNQVWTNLIDNALDALDGQGQITLRTRHEDGWVIVEVEDNGPGIPEDVQERLFDAFFTTKPAGKGTGLGLNISHNIVVHKHRGEIMVESQPGRTVFQVRLPLNFENM